MILSVTCQVCRKMKSRAFPLNLSEAAYGGYFPIHSVALSTTVSQRWFEAILTCNRPYASHSDL